MLSTQASARVAGALAGILATVCLVACSDVGDNTSVPGTTDSGAQGDATVEPLDSGGSPAEDGGADAPAPDSGTPSQGSDASVEEAGANATEPDAESAGGQDATVADTGASDAPVAETGGPDATLPEASTPDSGADTGEVAEASAPDGAADSGPADAGPHEAGPPCVPSGSGPAGTFTGNSATCTPTEHEIFDDKGQDCLSCLFGNFCLDDTSGPPDVNQECGDISGNAAAGPAMGQSRSSLCLAELHCMLTSIPDCTASGAANCYCGTIPVDAGNCLTQGAADGVCLVPEENALESTSASFINGNFASPIASTGNPAPTLGGQIANSILNCAHSANCTTCYD